MAPTFHLYDTQHRTYASKTVFQVLYTSNTITHVTHHIIKRAAGETDAVLLDYLLLCITYINDIYMYLNIVIYLMIFHFLCCKIKWLN